MRLTRAYIAGFGTAGSLLAGAAVVFVLASAVVSFNGWPQLDNHMSAPALVRATAPASIDPAGPRRVAAVLATQRAAAPPGLTASIGAASRGASAGGSLTSIASTGGRGVVINPGGRASINPLTPVGSAPACATGCSGRSGGGLGGVVQQSAGALGATLAGSGASLGSTVGGVASSLAGNVNGLSSSLAGTVAGAGQMLGNTVRGATGATGASLSGAGHTLGALLGAH